MLCFVSKFLARVNVWMDGGMITSLRIQEEQDREGRAPVSGNLKLPVSFAAQRLKLNTRNRLWRQERLRKSDWLPLF